MENKQEIFNNYSSYEQPSNMKDYCKIDEEDPGKQWIHLNQREFDGDGLLEWMKMKIAKHKTISYTFQ